MEEEWREEERWPEGIERGARVGARAGWGRRKRITGEKEENDAREEEKKKEKERKKGKG